MKQLSTLLQNAVEDYFTQLNEITLNDLQEVCEFNLSDVTFKALSEVQNFKQKTTDFRLATFIKAGNTLIGFPVGEKINALINLRKVAKTYGYDLFYGLETEPYLFCEVIHTYEDNYKIVAVGFEKIKK